MQDLTFEDIEIVGGGVARRYDWVPGAQSEWGNLLNDITNMLGQAGAWLGGRIYDMTHRISIP